MKGNPKTLVGPELKAGDAAPDFSLVDGGLNAVTLKDGNPFTQPESGRR